MFSALTMPEEFENSTNADGRKAYRAPLSVHVNHMIIMTLSFSRTSFSKCFPSTLNWRKANVFKFLRFEEVFTKFRFRDGLGMDGWSGLEIKLCIKIYSAWCGWGLRLSISQMSQPTSRFVRNLSEMGEVSEKKKRPNLCKYCRI